MICQNASELRNKHLTERTSAHNIKSSSMSSKTIINTQRIEKVILIWKQIKYLIAPRE